jgi:hypothetical protein
MARHPPLTSQAASLPYSLTNEEKNRLCHTRKRKRMMMRIHQHTILLFFGQHLLVNYKLMIFDDYRTP